MTKSGKTISKKLINVSSFPQVKIRELPWTSARFRRLISTKRLLI